MSFHTLRMNGTIIVDENIVIEYVSYDTAKGHSLKYSTKDGSSQSEMIEDLIAGDDFQFESIDEEEVLITVLTGSNSFELKIEIEAGPLVELRFGWNRS